MACGGSPAAEQGKVACAEAAGLRACFSDPVDRYGHGVLGETPEWGGLAVFAADGSGAEVLLPESRVFEDLVPRVFADGDSGALVAVVESDLRRGAQLAVYERDGEGLRKRAATAPIGRRFRWLAPAGVADFNGNGQPDIAYVETPHLRMILRIVELRGGELVELASLSGVSNHRIGDDFISGGVRRCGGEPEIVVANSGWTRALAVRLKDGALKRRDLGPLGREADPLANYMVCG